MTFTRDATQQQFPKRNISDVPSYVGSITPMREISGFIKQSTLAASAGAIGKGISGAISAASNPGGAAAGVAANFSSLATGALAAGISTLTLLTPGAMLDSWMGRWMDGCLDS